MMPDELITNLVRIGIVLIGLSIFVDDKVMTFTFIVFAIIWMIVMPFIIGRLPA